jgi:hypothetical protein
MVGSSGVAGTEDLPNDSRFEAFFAMKECKCLKRMWDIARSLWVPRFERAVFVGGLLGKKKFLVLISRPLSYKIRDVIWT